MLTETEQLYLSRPDLHKDKFALPIVDIPIAVIKKLEDPSSRYDELYMRTASGASLRGTLLGEVHASLMAPIYQEGVMKLDMNNMYIREVDPALSVQTAAVINAGYNRRYYDGADYIHLAGSNELLHHPGATTYVATTVVGESEVVLATMRSATNGAVEVFDLFEMQQHKKWPHEIANVPPAELKRMALHPVLDMLLGVDDPELKQLVELQRRIVIREIWRALGAQLEAANCLTYYIASPKVRTWVDSAGVGPIAEVEAIIDTTSQNYQQLIKTFGAYWGSDPRLYLSPTIPAPISWKIGEKTYTIN